MTELRALGVVALLLVPGWALAGLLPAARLDRGLRLALAPTAAVALVTLAALVLYPPFLPTAKLALRRLRSRLGTDLGPLREAEGRLRNFETAADHLTAGRVLYHQGRLHEALPHLIRAVEIDPRHAASRYQLGLDIRATSMELSDEQRRELKQLGYIAE